MQPGAKGLWQGWHLVACGQQADKEAVQHLHLATQAQDCRDRVLSQGQLGAWLVEAAEHGVVADVAELHDGVVDALDPPGNLPAIAGCASEQRGEGGLVGRAGAGHNALNLQQRSGRSPRCLRHPAF